MEAKWLCAEVEHRSLPFLDRDSGEVNTVLTNFNVGERSSQRLLVSPEHNYLILHVYKCANNVSNWPSFTVSKIVPVPFLDPISIVRVRGGVIANTSLRIEGSLNCAPSDLHQSICFQLNLIIKFSWENTRVSSYRTERAYSFNIEVISISKDYLSVSWFLIQLRNHWANSPDFLAFIQVRQGIAACIIEIQFLWLSWSLLLFLIPSSGSLPLCRFHIHWHWVLFVNQRRS